MKRKIKPFTELHTYSKKKGTFPKHSYIKTNN